ncbi:MAG: hypothetical protein U5L45_04005 [Saprospiraceae bacterium]|nr:hypothetical protein [Saprospiraceae bacterium]
MFERNYLARKLASLAKKANVVRFLRKARKTNHLSSLARAKRARD